MHRNLKVLLILLMTLSPFVCADIEMDEIRLQEIEADVVLRGWDQKGFGEKVATSTISVITAPGYKGDIVILRKTENDTGFIAEVYKPKPGALNPDSWEFVSGNIEKSIARQPNGAFQLFEIVDEGVRIETIDLDDKN